jgi:hypothetical protein
MVMRLGLAKRPRWILPVVAVLVASPLLGAAAQPGAPVREPAFELVGVVEQEGDASFALLQEPELTMGKPVLIRKGQSIGAYRLVAIEDGRVRLESATGVVTVLLGGSGGSSGAGALIPPPEPEARQARSVPTEPQSDPAAAEAQGAVSPAATAEESVEAALKGTPGEKVMNIFKKAFGLGGGQ